MLDASAEPPVVTPCDVARQGVLLPLEHHEMWLAVNDVQDGAFIHLWMPEAQGAWARVTSRALAFPGRSVLTCRLDEPGDGVSRS